MDLPRRILRGERVKTVARDKAEGPLERPISEHRFASDGGSALFSLLMLGLGGASWPRMGPRRRRGR